MDELKDNSKLENSLIQEGLRALGYYKGTCFGIPGTKTFAAFARYKADRVSGSQLPEPTEYSPNGFSEKLLAVANSQVGVTEIGGNNKGAQIDEYEKATWIDHSKAWPWCASFVCWCIQQASEDYPIPFKRPTTPRAFEFAEWGKAQGLEVIDEPKSVRRGDIVIFKYSHIGIAESDSNREGKFNSIEGNTGSRSQRDGDGVYRKLRPVSGKYGLKHLVRFK